MKEILEKSGYIIIVTLVILGLILVMRKLRSDALAELKKTLYIDHDPAKYLGMLKSRSLRLVLRRGTLLLMELEGLLYTGEKERTRQTIEALEKQKLSKAEKLDFYQRKLSYYLQEGENRLALESCDQIDQLLKNEKDENLKQIRAEAKLLIDIYVKKDVSRLGSLLKRAKQQSGVQLGITEFRIAKLYHFKNDDKTARDYLQRAVSNLKGTAWQSIARDAINDLSLLEKN